MKYKYTGTEQRKIISSTGKFVIVNEGDVFELKSPVNLDNIEAVKSQPKKTKLEDKK